MVNDLRIRIHSDDPRLKRHINHDPRSADYRLDTGKLAIGDVEHVMHIKVMDQGDVGKCTAEAATETLASDPFWATIPAALQSALGDVWSNAFYSAEETLDGDGPYPPNDRGSSGLTSARVAKSQSLISGYLHTFTADDAIKGLQTGPAQWGTLWKTGMDDVNEDTGQVRYTGDTRGGHEMCFYKVAASAEQLWFRQSWGAWGYQRSGVGWISFDDFAKSLKDQGDVTFFTPLGQPAPTPTPAPPMPTPSTVQRNFTSDQAAALDAWAGAPHVWSKATKAAKAWKAGG